MRMLVGNETAAMLGLGTRHTALMAAFHRLIAGLLRIMQLVISPFGQPFQPTVPLSAKLGRRVVDHVTLSTYGKRTQVAIPPGWG